MPTYPGRGGGPGVAFRLSDELAEADRSMTLTAKAMWGEIGTAAILLGAGVVVVVGSVVVIDRGGKVEAVSLVGSRGAVQPLRRLPGGVFVAIPRLEGEIAVRCRGGAHWQGGYVTPHMNILEAIRPGNGCRID